MNTYFRSIVLPKAKHATVLISERGREYRKEVGWLCAGFKVREWAEANHGQPLAVHVMAYPPDKRARDLDNCFKALLDSMKHGRVFRDDSDIWDLRITRACLSDPLGRVVVKLQRFDLGGVAP